MKTIDVVLMAVAWTASAALLWVSVPRAHVDPTAAERSAATPPAATRPARPPEARRNVFAYATRAVPATAPAPAVLAAPPRLTPAPVVAPAPAVAPVRVLGIVRRGTEARALVSVDGETMLLARGDRLRGYELVALDEGSVRLRKPDGAEMELDLE